MSAWVWCKGPPAVNVEVRLPDGSIAYVARHDDRDRQIVWLRGANIPWARWDALRVRA